MSDNAGGFETSDFEQLAENAEEVADVAGGDSGGEGVSRFVQHFNSDRGKKVAKVGKKVGGRLLDGSNDGPDPSELAENYGIPEPAAHGVRGCLRCVGVEDAPENAPPLVDFVKAILSWRKGGK